ncbi:substrate-binding domain-containing protein [Candidatus Sumerlaeota bacterium]|nr:substrate-binding domain-containing protein [Candidatus Sumerlaeota bacterium]
MRNYLRSFAALAILCASVSVRAADPPASTKKVTIAVIPKGTTHEFWKSIHAGAVKASRDLGVEIIWKGPQREDDREMQIQVVEDFISRKVDGIVLAPLDDKALVRPVNDAMKRKIPVVIIDSGLQGKDYVSFVATDNYKGGELGGKRLAEVMGGKGKVILLRYQEGSASTMEREKGFLDAIKKFPDIKIISHNQYAGATAETGYQKSEDLLNRFPGVEGVFCPNESSTFGMLRALTDAGKAGKVKFVGFDSSEKLIQALKDGHIHGLVQQNPFKMGELGVKTIVARIRGEKIEAKIDTGVGVVTKENMDQPEISTLLHPPLDEYLK